MGENGIKRTAMQVTPLFAEYVPGEHDAAAWTTRPVEKDSANKSQAVERDAILDVAWMGAEEN